MIILTAAEAAKVAGISPSKREAALEPVLLADSTFMLPEETLSDPAHADVKAFLAALPTSKADPVYETDVAKLAAAPKYKDAGVRKPDSK